MMSSEHNHNENGHAQTEDVAQESKSTQEGNDQLTSCQATLAKTEEQMRYLAADFENFRRNVAKERVQWTRIAQTKVFEDLVGIIDDFSLAVQDFQKFHGLSEAEQARFAGVELVYKNFNKFLEAQGVTEIKTDIPFNPELHEALVQMEAEGKEPGAIVDVLQRGYMHKDAVIRPAKVSVAK